MGPDFPTGGKIWGDIFKVALGFRGPILTDFNEDRVSKSLRQCSEYHSFSRVIAWREETGTICFNNNCLLLNRKLQTQKQSAGVGYLCFWKRGAFEHAQ